MSITLVYDGGCPFCRHFARRSELLGGLPDLIIRDGRSDHELRRMLGRRGFNLSNGAVLMAVSYTHLTLPTKLEV